MASYGEAAVRTRSAVAAVDWTLPLQQLVYLPMMLGLRLVSGVAEPSHMMPPAATSAAEPAVHRDYTAVIAAIPVIVVVALALAAAAASLAAAGIWQVHRALAGPAGALYDVTASAKAALPVVHELR